MCRPRSSQNNGFNGLGCTSRHRNDSESPAYRAFLRQNGLTMKRYIVIAALFVLCSSLFAQKEVPHQPPSCLPAHKATGVNPDTHLLLIFPSKPTLGTSGQIRIYDAADNRLVDLLDLSIPPGPTTAIQVPPVPPYSPTPY